MTSPGKKKKVGGRAEGLMSELTHSHCLPKRQAGADLKWFGVGGMERRSSGTEYAFSQKAWESGDGIT